jgi:bacterial/archaeal transporter family-2 protein
MIGTYWPHLLAIVVGAGLTAQVGMNATLGRAIDSPLWASIVNFTIGLAALVACALAAGSRAQVTAFGQVPAWAWLGGLLGAAYVFAVTLLGPRLGAVALLALVLAGQLGAALVVDHFGVLGFPRAEVNASRLLGVALLVAGALLVVRR